jgi:hypothetical protein
MVTRHSGPESEVPDDQRCEALVKGHPAWVFEWMKVDHRCPKRANQCRSGRAVCHIHARSKTIAWWRMIIMQPPHLRR